MLIPWTLCPMARWRLASFGDACKAAGDLPAARPGDREAPRRYDLVLMACCRHGESLNAVFGVLLGQRQPVPHDVAGERAYDGPVFAEAPC